LEEWMHGKSVGDRAKLDGGLRVEEAIAAMTTSRSWSGGYCRERMMVWRSGSIELRGKWLPA
jgi:hypothetical protein